MTTRLDLAIDELRTNVGNLRDLVHIKTDGTFVDGLADNLEGLQQIASFICDIDEAMDELLNVGEGLRQLREPFPAAVIGKLPKLMTCCSQANGVCSRHKKERCAGCNNWISTGHIHLDYVGHAAVRDRLQSVDPTWTWRPIRWTEDGFPAFDKHGGMWIEMTVLGTTRPGYGDGGGNVKGADAIKAAISDAIKNAAMNWGVAIDLWSKEDLLTLNPPVEEPQRQRGKPEVDHGDPVLQAAIPDEMWIKLCRGAGDLEALREHAKACDEAGKFVGEVKAAFLARKKEFERHLKAVKDPATAAS